MRVKAKRADESLRRLGYRIYLSKSGHTLHARRGQDHITIALPSGNLRAHKDIPIPSPTMHLLHRSLKGPFSHDLIKEFKKAYKSTPF